MFCLKLTTTPTTTTPPGGFSITELRELYKDQVHDAFTPSDWKAENIDVRETLEAGYAMAELKDGGYTAGHFKNANYSIGEIKQAGFTPRNYNGGGYTVSDVYNVGHTRIVEIKWPDSMLRQ